MKSLTPGKFKILTLAGLFFLSVPLFIYGLWIHACNLGATQSECVAIFHNYFPDFLKGRYGSIYVGLGFCIPAIILSIICLRLSGKFWKALNTIVLVLSGLLFLLNLFGLM